MKFFLRYWLPVMLWMCLIFGASSDIKSVQHTDGMLGQIFRRLHINVTPDQLEHVRFVVRKLAHMTEYGVLALLVWRALRGPEHARGWSNKSAALALTICLLYAATDEFHQAFVPGRSASVRDILIDTTGAALALGFAALITTRRARVTA